MSMNGVNNLNKAEIAKLALAQKSGKTAAAQQPEHMTKNGSIFKAPETKQTETPKSINELKTLDANNMKTKSQCEQALKDINTLTEKSPLFAGMFKGKIQEITAKKNELSHNASMQNLENMKNGISTKKSNNVQGQGQNNNNSPEAEAAKNAKDISASEGKKMAADMDKRTADLQSQTKETEANAKKSNKYASDAQKNQKQIVKQQKDLQKQEKSATKEIQANQQEIVSLLDELDTDETEVQTLQAELDSLTAGDNTGVGVNSAFSLSLAGTEEHNQGLESEDPNAARIAELQSQIGAKNAVMTTKGQRIGKLQTTTNKQIQTMHKVSTRYMAGINATQKTMESNLNTSQKIMSIANDFEEVSTTIATAGKVLNNTGKALVAIGSMIPMGFGAGLVVAGQVMQKFGVIAEMVGQYGQCAAGITKTACNVAQGNLAGALTSAGAAIMSGASAQKTYNNLGSTFSKIDEQAKEALQKNAEKVAERTAKKTAEKSAEKIAEGLAKNDLLGGMTQKEAQKGFEAFLKDPTQLMTGGKDKIADTVKDTVKEGVKDEAKESLKDKVKEGIKEKSKDMFSHDNLMKIGKGLQTAGAKLGATNPQQGQGVNGNKQANRAYYAPPPSFQSMQRLAEIQNRGLKRA